MTSHRSSPFDDMLANSKRQFEDLVGGRPAPLVKPAARPPSHPTTTAETAGSDAAAGTALTVRGTANGIPFTLRTL